MAIDAHAHACGELGTINGIMSYLHRNELSKIVLCPGEQNSRHNYPMPLIADAISSQKIGYGFNWIIQRVVRLSGVAKTLDEQNKYISSLTQKYPNQILQTYWLNPTSLNEIKRMESFYRETPFCVVKLHQCWHSFDISNNDIVNTAILWAETHCIPVFIHLLSDEQCRAFTTVANEHPSCIFIVGHMLGFSVIAPALKHDNVYFDISAPFMIPKLYLHEAVNLWGGSRLILGSDTPYGNENIKKNMHRIEQLKITEQEKTKIMGGNIEFLLSLRR